MEIGLVRQVDIDREMQQSYLDYAMSVIVSRALPDARDGLKPVQRRILYAMYDMGLRAESTYKKSARIVGEVLGKYHPHGDLAVYEAMARMAQDFSMREALVDGQGNFGSVDGDPPAAMRYTEARLSAVSMEMLNQLDRDTVNFGNNFDETLKEPEVLPAAIPNLLVNGGSGIAVGMATSIPPHNLEEVIDALTYLLDRWDKQDDVTVTDLMDFVKGPDFPTGGIILQESDRDDLQTAYATGRGRVTLRGRVHLEEAGRGRSRIIVTELPYQTNKAALMERIADLVREGGLEGIADLRDESDRRGMRIVIELNKAAEYDKVLRELYRRTSLQTTFRISLLALVDNEPRLLSLKQALRVYLEHRLEVVRRRSEFDLARARQRGHILEGLLVALQHLDEVITLIRRSTDADDARVKLMRKYKLDEPQAQAILEMPLRRLAALERKKIEEEYRQVQQTIRELESLLASPKKMRQAVQAELLQIKDRYADKRRTQIVRLREGETAADLLTASDLTPGLEVWITISADGYLGRISGEKPPKMSGRHAPALALPANTHNTLYLVTRQGRAAAMPVQTLPEIDEPGEGQAFYRLTSLPEGEGLAAAFSLPPNHTDEKVGRFVFSVSRKGMVKKTELPELPGPSSQPFTLVKINEADELLDLLHTDGARQIFLATASGMGIRFNEQEVRPMGLVAAGVNAIKLSGPDQVVAAAAVDGSEDLLLVSATGKGWRLPVGQFPVQGRYGQGVIAVRLNKDDRLAVLLAGNKNQSGWLRLSGSAGQGLKIDHLPVGKRATAGRDLVALKPSEKIIGLTLVQGAALANGSRGAPSRKKNIAGSINGRSTAQSSASAKSRKTGVRKFSSEGKATAITESPSAKRTPNSGITEKDTGGVPKTSSKPAAKKTAKPAARKTAARPAEKKTTPKRATGTTKEETSGAAARSKAAGKTDVAARQSKPASQGGRKPATAKKTPAKTTANKAPVSPAKVTPTPAEKKPQASKPPGSKKQTSTKKQ